MSPAPPARAIVSHGPVSEGKWAMEQVRLRDIAADELVIRVAASGVCHTDLHFGGQKEGFGVVYPSVKGHEGSGYVESVGANVTVAAPGDPVLLSFSSCGTCALCSGGHPAHCVDFNTINFLGGPDFALASSAGEESVKANIAGRFFGQSSFASRTIARESSVVNVKGLVNSDEELQLLAPLGCGIQTGSGTIAKVAEVGEGDCVAILGMGGVGLSGVMAAKIRNCRTVIGIDKVASRLQLAKELGATHVINTAGMGSLAELVEAVRAITDGLGSTVTMDTTGFLPLIQKAVEFTRPRGKILQVGTAPIDAKLDIPIFEFMVAGKQYIGAVEGDSITSESVPLMIRWWREGKFPLEKLVKRFKAEDFKEAIKEMHEGVTVKPVIVW
ncbi:putative alcohol dehydrogenase [Cenococcum geophilum 1.58]|uniref:putative alcohol dehydrogenase n=1 Tax=Cenococcum geophilum 1.58 TaxID=794803 RepID=UPI00358E6D98|nr:putative alcohol dehydrogenase [Cenococcum geophilum 1.58]